MFSFKRSTLFTLGLIFALTGCGGGGGGGNVNGGSGDEVADSLTSLGVDVTETARQGDDLQPLPDDYTPFGSSRGFDVNEELVLLGFPLASGAFNNLGLTLMELDRQGTNAVYSDDVLFAPDPALTPWAVSAGDNPANLRAAARGDFDGDGLEELAVVYRIGGQNTVELQIYQDQTQNFTASTPITVTNDPATSLTLASGDFNGDGLTDLVVGVTMTNAAEILFIDNNNGILGVSGTSRALPQAASGSVIDLVIASGNIDYDPSHELVVLVNETFGTPLQGTTRYFVFDDGKQAFAPIADALVQANLNNVNRTVIVADVALGDIDGDNVDEIVFAGLTNFDPGNTCAYNYLMVALDDQIRNRVPLGAAEHRPFPTGDCTGDELRFVHVNTLDIDGDGVLEVQANELVYEDFAQFPPWTRLQAPLELAPGSEGEVELGKNDNDDLTPKIQTLFESNTSPGRFTRQSSDIVVADLTQDGRQDIIFYSQQTNVMQVWGLSDPNPNPPGPESRLGQWRLLKSIAINPPASGDVRHPVLLPLNVNHDSLAISFDEGEYQLVFTEPVLIAALAAAPCFDNLGQNTDACRTAFGTAKSNTVETEQTFTVTAGVTVGFESEFSAFGVKAAGIEALATLKASASTIKSSAYTITKRIVYTTGPIEDTVIFTTIPLDQYTYTITSHPNDPELIGSKVVLSMPRTPVEIQVSRGFYNANVLAGGPLIDASVFSHTAGDPPSYPSQSSKDTALGQYVGLEIGPVTVGEGGGFKTLEINVATQTGTGSAYGVDFEFAVQGTAGVVVAGFSVGTSSEKSLQILHGDESSYEGTVSNLPSSTFAANNYSWGLFTYVIDDHPSGQQFEAINYWVD